MESSNYLVSNWPFSQEAPLLRSGGVANNPTLAGGLLIAFSLAGLVTFIWAFWSQPSGRNAFKRSFIMSCSGQYGNLMGVQNVHSALTSLIIMDILNGITAMILGSALIGYCSNQFTCVYSFIAWFLSRCFVVIFHLLVALVSVLHLCDPMQGAYLRCILTVASLLIAVTTPVYIFAPMVATIILAIIIFGLALTIIVKCKVPAVSPSAATQKKRIVFVSMFTLLVVYFPAFVLECLIFTSTNAVENQRTYVEFLIFASYHIIFDAVLSFLILRLSAGEEQQLQQQQQQQQPPPQQWHQHQHQQHEKGFENPEFNFSENVTT